jgi:serine/threonine protein kinase
MKEGDVISNYHIDSLIGEGGMGRVYLAEHINLKRKVALKVLNPEIAGIPEVRARFDNEAMVLASLDHQYIIRIHDYFKIDKDLIIIMEFAEGIPLNRIISLNGALKENICLTIFEKILEAFSYAHRKGIIHRDIKPSNIMIKNESKPKILDFGIAKITHSDMNLTRTGTKIGSIYYMSPEQVLSKDIDYRSDIYSLGVTLYEMLSGNLPYDTDTDSDYLIQDQIVRAQIKPIRNLVPDISPETEYIINIATNRNREDRFQSCDDFLKAVNLRKSNNFQQLPDSKTVYIDNKSKTQFTNIKQNPQKIYWILTFSIIAVVIIVLVGLFIYNSQLNKDENVFTETKKKDTIKTEIDKGTNTENKNIPDNKEIIKKQFNEWVSSMKTKSIGILNFYSDPVNYFYLGIKSKNYIANEKMKFFKKWDNFEMEISNLVIDFINATKYKCTFDNKFILTNYSSNKKLDAKTRNHLIFEKNNDSWLIIEEIEEHQYYVNKNY